MAKLLREVSTSREMVHAVQTFKAICGSDVYSGSKLKYIKSVMILCHDVIISEYRSTGKKFTGI